MLGGLIATKPDHNVVSHYKHTLERRPAVTPTPFLLTTMGIKRRCKRRECLCSPVPLSKLNLESGSTFLCQLAAFRPEGRRPVK